MYAYHNNAYLIISRNGKLAGIMVMFFSATLIRNVFLIDKYCDMAAERPENGARGSFPQLGNDSVNTYRGQ
jgi:hypothetical protein